MDLEEIVSATRMEERQEMININMSDIQLNKYRDILVEAEQSQIVPIKKTAKFKDTLGQELKVGHL